EASTTKRGLAVFKSTSITSSQLVINKPKIPNIYNVFFMSLEFKVIRNTRYNTKNRKSNCFIEPCIFVLTEVYRSCIFSVIQVIDAKVPLALPSFLLLRFRYISSRNIQVMISRQTVLVSQTIVRNVDTLILIISVRISNRSSGL